ncbi:MAG: PhnD/SsuA/transferrin family substrate-binding protein [Nitrospirae bacterium]|nr:PhnD/SsuA/transferrin family substrate-binding protein [Nitrospirota bacterium]
MNQRQYALTLAPAVVGVGILLGTGWFLNVGEKAIDVRMDYSVSERDSADAPPYRVAVGPILSPNRTAHDYELLTNYLENRLSHPVRLIQQKTHAEVNELLRNGAVQVALLCPGAYVRAKEVNLPIENIAVPVYDDGPVDRALIVVRANRPARTVRELKGYAFAYTDTLSLAGYYYPLFRLLSLGIEPQGFFSRTTFTHSSDGSLEAVASGVVDAAAVDSPTYRRETHRNPSLRDALQVIDTSPLLGAPPVVVPTTVSAYLRGRLQKAFLVMDKIPRGRKALEAMGVLRFEVPTPSLYDSAREIHDRVDAYLEGEK